MLDSREILANFDARFWRKVCDSCEKYAILVKNI